MNRAYPIFGCLLLWFGCAAFMGCSGGDCQIDDDCRDGERCSPSGGLIFGGSVCIDVSYAQGDGGIGQDVEDHGDGGDVDADIDVDREIPKVIFTETPPEFSAESEAYFQFSCSLEACEMYCFLDEIELDECDGEVELSPVEDGERHFVVVPRVDGLDGAASEVVWHVDTTTPELVVIQGPEEVEYLLETTFELACSKRPCELSCWIDSEEIDECGSGEFVVPVDFQAYEMRVVAEDPVGRQSTTVIEWEHTFRDTIVVTTQLGEMVRLSPRMEEIWRYSPPSEHDGVSLEGGLNPVAVDPDGYAYAGGHNNGIAVKVDARGQQVWLVRVDELGESGRVRGIAVDNAGNIYLGVHNGGVIKLNSQGAVEWSALGDEGTVYDVIVDGEGRVFTGSIDHRMRQLNAATGEVEWVEEFSDSIRAVNLGTDGTYYAASDNGVIYHIDAERELLGSFTEDWSVYQISMHPDGYLTYASRQMWVRRLHETSMSEEWCFGHVSTTECPGPMTDRPHQAAVSVDGSVYAGTRDSMVYKISNEGELEWAYDGLEGAIHGVAVDPGRYTSFPDVWTARQ